MNEQQQVEPNGDETKGFRTKLDEYARETMKDSPFMHNDRVIMNKVSKI